MADLGSEIVNFYRGRSIFITGASGFIGKVLVEKLLRSCPDIAHIYVLMRPKRGNNVNTRMDAIIAAKLFDNLRQNNPSALAKVVPIVGDLTQPDLGISAGDIELLSDDVSVVFHSAATVKFDESLKTAVQMNIVGTKYIAELCQKMRKLDAVIHISTAYCYCEREVLDEVLYPTPADPQKLIDWLEWMNEDLVNEMTPKILAGRPNTYTYTKAVAEHVFVQSAHNLPCAIIRPSIVTASWKEPFPGWIDNLNGPTGLIAGSGKGLIKTLLSDRKMVADFIPVDILVNLMIAVGWHTASTRSKKCVIYNCTSGTVNPVHLSDVEKVLKDVIHSKAFREVLWYPGGSMTTSPSYHRLRVLMYHILPAYLMDGMLLISGKSPQMVNIQKKVWKGIDVLQFFFSKEWKFSSHNTCTLYSQLNNFDQQIFNFDISQVKWHLYLEQYFCGIKTYIFKESKQQPSNYRRMCIIKRCTDVLVFMILMRVLMALWTPPYKKILYSFLGGVLQAARCLNFGK